MQAGCLRHYAIFCALVLFWCVALVPAQSPPVRHTLLFRNGDLIFGQLQSIAPDHSVTWRRMDSPQPMEFFGTNISEIQFSSGKKPGPFPTNGCRVRLQNGDALEGRLTQIDSEKITLETLFAGKMDLPRRYVQSLESLPPERAPIFTGPAGLEGWTIGKVTATVAGETGEWRYTNGAFYATRAASIARDLQLPDVARIQFDLAWKGSLQAAVALYTSHMQPINLANKENEPDFGGFYSLQINNFMATIMPVQKNRPLTYLGQAPVPAFNQKNRAHVELRVSKPGNRIALLVDGALIKDWFDPDGFAGTGTAMRFVHQGQGAIKLSHLRISEWNGRMEEKGTNDFRSAEDLAKFSNGDKASGKLETFREGKIIFATGEKKLEIPLGRVAEIWLAPRGDNSAPPKTSANVRVFFPGGESVVFQIEQWNDEAITGISPYFGRATFAPGTFERVQFSPEAPPPQKGAR